MIPSKENYHFQNIFYLTSIILFAFKMFNFKNSIFKNNFEKQTQPQVLPPPYNREHNIINGTNYEPTVFDKVMKSKSPSKQRGSPSKQRGYTGWKIGGKRASQRMETTQKEESETSQLSSSMVAFKSNLLLQDSVDELSPVEEKKRENEREDEKDRIGLGGGELELTLDPHRVEENEENAREYDFEAPDERAEREGEEREEDEKEEDERREEEEDRYCQRSDLTDALSSEFTSFHTSETTKKKSVGN